MCEGYCAGGGDINPEPLGGTKTLVYGITFNNYCWILNVFGPKFKSGKNSFTMVQSDSILDDNI